MSKVDEILANTRLLITRLIEEGGKIVDFYVKHELLKALNLYYAYVERKESRGHITHEKKELVNSLLDEAWRNVDQIPARQCQYELSEAWKGKNLSEMKHFVVDLEKKILQNKIRDEECAELFEVVIVYSQKVRSNPSKPLLKPNEEEGISLLLLKLFLRLPRLLDEISHSLDGVIKNFNKLGVENFHDFNKQKLLIIKQKIEYINELMEHNIAQMNIPRECGTSVSVMGRGSGHQNDIPKIHNSKTLKIFDKTDKEISEKLQFLKELEQKVSSLMNSNEIFQENKKNSEKIEEEFNQMNTDVQKINILNRIEGLILVETIIYLRHIKKSLDRYKQYAQEFAFPKNIAMYGNKKEEICKLKNDIEGLPTENSYVKVRVQRILDYVEEVLKILDKRAENNQNIIQDLKHLGSIQNELRHHTESSQSMNEKLRMFNEMRRRLETIKSTNRRILAKKLEIRNLLQFQENKIYDKCFPDMVELKSHLDKHEEDAQRFFHPIDGDIYRQKQKEVGKILAGSHANAAMTETTQVVLSLLEKSAQVVKEKKDRIQKLTSILDEATSGEAIKQFKNNLISEKMLSKQQDDVLNVLRDLDLKADCKLSQETLTELGNTIRSIKEDITNMGSPTPKDVFIEKLNQLFYIKDTIDDMPEGDTELDSHKDHLLRQLQKILHVLDESIAQSITEKKESDKILELHHHFTKFSPDVDKNSIDFIQMIRERAQSFQENISNYLGGNDSVDYYIMHENLIRLLEELDKLARANKEELMPDIIKTHTYIKNLMENLKLNACNY